MLLDIVPLEGISSAKIQMGIKPHLNQVSLDYYCAESTSSETETLNINEVSSAPIRKSSPAAM